MVEGGGASSGEAASSGRLPNEAGVAAARGDETPLLAWLDSGGRVNATCGEGDVYPPLDDLARSLRRVEGTCIPFSS